MKHTKQMISGLCALLTAGTMLGSAMPAFALDPPRYGDFNQDGEITVEDAQLVLQIYADNMAGVGRTLTEWEIMLADVDKDGTVDLPDAQFILLYYAENTLGGNDKSWEEILNPVSDYDVAYDTLTAMMEGVMQRDVDAMLEYTDMYEVVRVMALIFTGEDYTEEDFRAEMETDDETVISYRILRGREDRALMEEYNKAMEEDRAETEQDLAELEQNHAEGTDEELDEETYEVLRTLYTQFLQMLQPLEKLFVFDVRIEEESETETRQLYVACKNGKWYVDTTLIESFISSQESEKQSDANDAAKSVYKAFNSAAIDLDNENYPLGLLDGVYVLTGADFENIKKPTAENVVTEQAMLAVLCAQTAMYFPDITELPQIAVYVKGSCSYAAAAMDFGGELWFGCYPNSMDSASHKDIKDIEAALAYAMQDE